MKASNSRSAVEVFFLSLWALGTLVLLFCVILLVREMIRAGQDPLAMVRTSPVEAPVSEAAPVVNSSLGLREVLLYFASEDGRVLVPQPRKIECGDSTLENCRAALAALIAGPGGEGLTPILPAKAKVRALYLLDDGSLVVDFSSEVKTGHARLKSVSLEALLAYGVIQTLSQQALQGGGGTRVRSVRLLFDGAPQDTFPAHLDIEGGPPVMAPWLGESGEAGVHG